MKYKSNGTNIDRFNLILKAAKVGHSLQARSLNDPENEYFKKNIALLALEEVKATFTESKNDLKDDKNIK